MDKNELQELLLGDYRDGYLSVDVWQQRPSTAVKVEGLYKDNYISAYGFSKVCWPDTWDAGHGIDLAVRKAIAYLARELSGE